MKLRVYNFLHKQFMEEDALIYAKDQCDENKLHIYDFKLKKMDYLNFLI